MVTPPKANANNNKNNYIQDDETYEKYLRCQWRMEIEDKQSQIVNINQHYLSKLSSLSTTKVCENNAGKSNKRTDKNINSTISAINGRDSSEISSFFNPKKKITQSDTNKNVKKKKEKTGKSSAAVEVNRVLTDKETTPNGNIKFEIEKKLSLTDGEVIQPIFKWKFMTLSSKKLKNSNFNTIYKKCLGVYQCPDCNFVEAPRQPIKKTDLILMNN